MQVQFSTFDIGYGYICQWDWVVILDSDGEELLNRSCGTTIPNTISFTNEATLLLYSNYYELSRSELPRGSIQDVLTICSCDFGSQSGGLRVAAA